MTDTFIDITFIEWRSKETIFWTFKNYKYNNIISILTHLNIKKIENKYSLRGHLCAISVVENISLTTRVGHGFIANCFILHSSDEIVVTELLYLCLKKFSQHLKILFRVIVTELLCGSS